MATRLLLVRHGRTQWNHDMRFQGQCDVPLNEEGVRQAELLRDRLRGERLDAVYSSDLARCRRTAEVIAQDRGLPVVTSPALRECGYGLWEGRTLKEIRAEWPETVEARWRDPERVAPPGGEAFAQVRERVTAYLNDVVARHLEANVLVVGHGGCLLAFITGLMHMQLSLGFGFRLDNCSLSVAEFDRHGCRLVSLNDVCHITHEHGFGVPSMPTTEVMGATSAGR